MAPAGAALDDRAAGSASAQAVASSSSSSSSSSQGRPSGSDTMTASSQRPDAHTQRYDRQLRLWASSGQASLESARIAVLGASHLGACFLKNLVLPGVGSFELIDAREVDAADIGNNFFIESGGGDEVVHGKGKSRASEVARNLAELNPQVRAHAIVKDPSEWVRTTSLDDYTLIVAINQPQRVLLPLADKAWDAKAGVGVPLMALTSCGLVGRVDIQIREAGIIETHPENTIDLRLTNPWPELEVYAQKYNVGTDDSMERSHIPFIVILLRQLAGWRKQHDGQAPQPSKDRKAFTDLVNSMRGAGHADGENVDEAIGALGQHVWRPIAAGKDALVPSQVLALFTDNACENIDKNSSNFWLLVRALRDFVRKGDGTLPLPGSLPDFKALSATYVEVQRLYRAKAQLDLQRLGQHLADVLTKVGLPGNAISADELESFAKHTSYLKLIRGRPLREKGAAPNPEALAMAFADPINPITIPYYFAFEAAQLFYNENGRRFPGSSAALSRNVTGEAQAKEDAAQLSDSSRADFDSDVSNLIVTARMLVTSHHLSLDEEQLETIDDACHEVARGAHADIPSTSALLGGIAAQEAIKLVTRQYVPMDNTAVYDGIKQAIGVFQL